MKSSWNYQIDFIDEKGTDTSYFITTKTEAIRIVFKYVVLGCRVSIQRI